MFSYKKMVQQINLKTNFNLRATGGYFHPILLITLGILKMEHYCIVLKNYIDGASLMVG